MDEKLFEVKFHFPYDSFTKDKATDAEVTNWETRIRVGVPFWVSTYSCTRMLVNPTLLTYMEVNDYRPF